MLCSTSVGRRPRRHPRAEWRDYVKILVGLALAFYQSIYPSLQRIEMLGGFNLSCCRRDPSRISGFRKVSYILSRLIAMLKMLKL